MTLHNTSVVLTHELKIELKRCNSVPPTMTGVILLVAKFARARRVRSQIAAAAALTIQYGVGTKSVRTHVIDSSA